MKNIDKAKKEVIDLIQHNLKIFNSKDWNYSTLLDGKEVGWWISEIVDNITNNEKSQQLLEAYIDNNIDDWINKIKE